MRAIVQRAYGNADVLKLESVGASVSGFTPGDEVYGEIESGSFAEYAVAPATSITAKPANLTFEEAATVPLSGMTALQGLRDAGSLRPGQRVLVNGASGGVGSFAVQIAKAIGAEVTAVASTRNAALVRGLGADHVVDYGRDDFTLVLSTSSRPGRFGRQSSAHTPWPTCPMRCATSHGSTPAARSPSRSDELHRDVTVQWRPGVLCSPNRTRSPGLTASLPRG